MNTGAARPRPALPKAPLPRAASWGLPEEPCERDPRKSLGLRDPDPGGGRGQLLLRLQDVRAAIYWIDYYDTVSLGRLFRSAGPKDFNWWAQSCHLAEAKRFILSKLALHLAAMANADFYPRYVAPRLTGALTDTPVVLIHGPRQSGKTTLARAVGDVSGYAYISFDDDVLRASAQADPVGFVADLPNKVVLDEVQRVPELFTSLKVTVDRDRRAGRFMLTGSTNVLLVPKLADSLAGRMEILRLYPLAQAELARTEPAFLDAVFGTKFKAGTRPRLGRQLAEGIAAGGYPAALTRSTPRRRAAWYRDYIDTLMQRDVRDLARISALDALPRLMALTAGQTARLLNTAELAAPFQLSRPTIRDYVVLLERVFLLEELPSWHSNRLNRLVKTPKLHVGDTGSAGGGYRGARVRSGPAGATARNLRVSGVAAASELGGPAGRLLSFPRQGRGRGGYCA